MTGLDIRFQGFSNSQLAQEISLLRGGSGAESFYTAVDALKTIATTLAHTDQTLRDQLSAIGVEWDSDDGRDFTVLATDQADYGAGADETISESASAVDSQGEVFSYARDVLPESGDLHGDTKTNPIDDIAKTLLGHDTDHAKQVARTNEARAQAVSGLDQYGQGTSSNLDRYRQLPVPPALDLSSKPISSADGSTVAAGFLGGAGIAPGGAGPGVGSPAGVPAPGGGGLVGGVPTPGGGGTISPPGTGGGLPVPGDPGGGLPGRLTGVGPMPGGGVVAESGLSGALRPGLAAAAGLNSEAALGAAMATGAGGGAAAGATEQDRLQRGARPAAFGPEAEARAAAGGRNSIRSMTGLAAEEATAVRNAERLAPGGTGKSGSSLMQPAASSAEDEEDRKHVRKFAVESDDVFADDRLVIDSVLGDADYHGE